MKKLSLIAVMLVGLFLMTSSATASVFTLTKPALLMLWEVYENPITSISQLITVTDDPVTYGQPMAGVVGYSGVLWDTGAASNPYSPFAQMQIGANFWGTSGALGTSGATTAAVLGAATGGAPTNDLSGFTKYSLLFHNDNDDDWYVNLFLNTGFTDWGEPDNYYENSWTMVAPGASVGLVLDLTGVANLNHVSNIGFNLGANMAGSGGNDPSNPDVFHTSVTPVPEPASLLLLGSGLLGLGSYGRARFGRKKK